MADNAAGQHRAHPISLLQDINVVRLILFRMTMLFSHILLGGDVRIEISSESLEGLRGVAIGDNNHKSIKKSGLGPRTRVPTLTPFTSTIEIMAIFGHFYERGLGPLFRVLTQFSLLIRHPGPQWPLHANLLRNSCPTSSPIREQGGI